MTTDNPGWQLELSKGRKVHDVEELELTAGTVTTKAGTVVDASTGEVIDAPKKYCAFDGNCKLSKVGLEVMAMMRKRRGL